MRLAIIFLIASLFVLPQLVLASDCVVQGYEECTEHSYSYYTCTATARIGYDRVDTDPEWCSQISGFYIIGPVQYKYKCIGDYVYLADVDTFSWDQCSKGQCSGTGIQSVANEGPYTVATVGTVIPAGSEYYSPHKYLVCSDFAQNTDYWCFAGTTVFFDGLANYPSPTYVVPDTFCCDSSQCAADEYCDTSPSDPTLHACKKIPSCDDGDYCTIDSISNHQCVHQQLEGCCHSNDDCSADEFCFTTSCTPLSCQTEQQCINKKLIWETPENHQCQKHEQPVECCLESDCPDKYTDIAGSVNTTKSCVNNACVYDFTCQEGLIKDPVNMECNLPEGLAGLIFLIKANLYVILAVVATVVIAGMFFLLRRG